jgi:hypothetical protein
MPEEQLLILAIEMEELQNARLGLFAGRLIVGWNRLVARHGAQSDQRFIQSRQKLLLAFDQLG